MIKFRRLSLRRLLIVPAVAMLTGEINPGAARAQEETDALQVPVPVQRVAEARRLLRSACATLQQEPRDESGRAAIMERALARTAEAAALWSSLREEFPTEGPGPYAAHPAWAHAVMQIDAGIREMATRIRPGDPAAARAACGANCGRFTALDEAAGLELSPDLLFRFRQAAKPLADMLARGDVAGVRAVLPRLARLRSRALAAPGTAPTARPLQLAAVEALSIRLDAFSEAVGTDAESWDAYHAMISALETAYDAVL